jgi:hypothetical protein
MANKEVYRRALARAREAIGGEVALARHLRVPGSAIIAWLSGEQQIPDVIFLRVVDLLVHDLQNVEDAVARHAGQALPGSRKAS